MCGAVYPVSDFRKCPDHSALAKWEPLILAAWILDARGGYFKQEHVHQALMTNLALVDSGVEGIDNAMGVIDATAVCGGLTRNEVVGLMAYQIRIMLSHARKHGPIGNMRPLVVCFPLFEDDECEDEDDELMVVCRRLDGMQAVTMLSDGSMIKADKYVKGEHGFIVASWAQWPNTTLVLELPNACLRDDGTLMSRPAPVVHAEGKAKVHAQGKAKGKEKGQAKGKAKHKAKGRAASAKGGGAQYSLVVAGGHHGDAAVFLRTNSKDKSQILKVGRAHVKSPSKVCDHVVTLMTHMLEHLPQGGKVKDLSSEFMVKFRLVAATLRDKAIAAGFGNK